MQKMVRQDIPALDIADVCKTYVQWQRGGQMKDVLRNLFRAEKREVHALNHLTFQVMPGEFVAYAGANGAGKSTTIKILSGILRQTSGSVRVLGMDPAAARVPLMRRIGVLFGQRTELWWDQPVISSYEWKKQVWNIPEKTYRKNLARVSELLDIGRLLKTFARELSLGQRMRADLGMMLLHGPELIFLDEPTLGLDVIAKRRMIEFLKQLNRDSGTTVVVTSHDMDDLEEMAQRMLLLKDGTVAFDSDFDGLRKAAGALGRVSVIAEACPDVSPGLRRLRSEGRRHEFEFDNEKITVNELLSVLSRSSGIEDIEIRKAPIEEVVASLY